MPVDAVRSVRRRVQVSRIGQERLDLPPCACEATRLRSTTAGQEATAGPATACSRLPMRNGRVGLRVLRGRVGRRFFLRWRRSRLRGLAILAGVGRRLRGRCLWTRTADRGPCAASTNSWTYASSMGRLFLSRIVSWDMSRVRPNGVDVVTLRSGYRRPPGPRSRKESVSSLRPWIVRRHRPPAVGPCSGSVFETSGGLWAQTAESISINADMGATCVERRRRCRRGRRSGLGPWRSQSGRR